MPSNERVEYVLQAVGQQQVAAAYQGVAKAIADSGRAADQLSQKLRSTARLAEVEARAAARAAERAAEAQRMAAVASGQAAKAANDGFGSMTTSARGVVSTLGQLANAAQGLAPEIAGVGGALGRVSSTIGVVTGALTGAGEGSIAGPAGLIVGGLIGAISALSLAFSDNKTKASEAGDELDEYAKQAEKAAQKLEDIERRIGRKYKFDFLADVQAMRAAAIATADQVFESSNKDQLAKFEREVAEALGPSAVGNVNDTAKKNLEDTQKKAGVDKTDEKMRALQKELDADAAIRAARKARDQERAEKLAPLEAAVTAAEQRQKEFEDYKNHDKRLWDLKQARIEEESAARAAAIADIEEKEGRRVELAKQAGAAVSKIGEQSYMMVANAAGNALAALVTGQKVSLAEIAKSIGGQAVAQGTVDLAHALFLTSNPITGPIFAGMVPAALAELAAGAALGATATALSGGFGGGGGGGGGSATASFRPSGLPASPAPFTGGSSQPAQGGNITINVNTLNASAETGVEIYRGLQRAQRQGLIPAGSSR